MYIQACTGDDLDDLLAVKKLSRTEVGGPIKIPESAHNLSFLQTDK